MYCNLKKTVQQERSQNCQKKRERDHGLQLHIGTKILLFEEVNSLNWLAIMTIFVCRKKGEACKTKNTIPTMVNHVGCSIMLWGCFPAGALHKIDGLMRRKDDVNILKHNFRTSARRLKLAHKFVFQMVPSDPQA